MAKRATRYAASEAWYFCPMANRGLYGLYSGIIIFHEHRSLTEEHECTTRQMPPALTAI